MSTLEAIEKLVKLLGGPTAAARAIGVSQPTVTGWLQSNHGVSVGSALKAEAATSGLITAESLCPDVQKIRNTQAA